MMNNPASANGRIQPEGQTPVMREVSKAAIGLVLSGRVWDLVRQVKATRKEYLSIPDIIRKYLYPKKEYHSNKTELWLITHYSTDYFLVWLLETQERRNMLEDDIRQNLTGGNNTNLDDIAIDETAISSYCDGNRLGYYCRNPIMEHYGFR